MASAFAGGIEFLSKLGIYDVVLPFILVFTLVYAFLEKTKVFGVEKYYTDDERKNYFKGSRRNLNSMTAFVTAFFVVASSQLVAVINQTLSQTVLLLLLAFCFMLVVGAFAKETEEGFYLKGTWKTIFMIIMFVAIIFIFLNALGWLDIVWNFVTGVWSSQAVASIVLIALIVGFIIWITKDSGKPPGKKKDDDDD